MQSILLSYKMNSMKILLYFLSYSFLLLLLGMNSALAEEDPKIRLLTTPSEPTDHLGQIILSLVAVLVIIFFAAWLLKRFSAFPGVASGHLRVLGALSVGQREKVVLLQAGNEQIVVGITASKITLLHKLEETVVVDEINPIVSGAFANRLQEALSRNKKEGQFNIKNEDGNN